MSRPCWRGRHPRRIETGNGTRVHLMTSTASSRRGPTRRHASRNGSVTQEHETREGGNAGFGGRTPRRCSVPRGLVADENQAGVIIRRDSLRNVRVDVCSSLPAPQLRLGGGEEARRAGQSASTFPTVRASDAQSRGKRRIVERPQRVLLRPRRRRRTTPRWRSRSAER